MSVQPMSTGSARAIEVRDLHKYFGDNEVLKGIDFHVDAGGIIVARDVHKWFGELHVLRGIDLTVTPGEVVVIFGASGSGKSTFIRTINRLEEHQRGQIIVDGIELTNDIRNIAAIRSEIGMVFQSFNLFPHLTALQNITLAPMRVRSHSRAECDVLEDRHVREQVERLEDHPHFAADLLDVANVVAHLDTVNDDPAAVVLLQPVDAADERGLSGAGRADDDDDFLLPDVEIDVLERLEVAEHLVDVLADDDRLPALGGGGVGDAGQVSHRCPTSSRCSSRWLARDIE